MLEFGQPHRVESLISTGLLQVGDGYRAKNDELSTTGLPFARGGNIDGGFHFDGADRFPVESLQRVGAKVSQVGDVVFTSKGTVGRFAFVRPEVERFVYSPQLCYWRSLSPGCIHPRWLYYWMHSTEFQEQFKGVAGQTDMADYVSLRDQRRFWITVPEPQVQESVANTLGALDDKIELNRRMNQTLEAMARALFKSWFVDFEPVVAKSEGRPTGLPPDLDALFPSEFEDSPLGEIPRGWSAGTIHNLAAMVRQQVNPLGTPEKLFAHHSIPAYDAAGAPVLEPGSAIKSNKFSVPKGSVLVSKLNPHIPRIWLTDVQDGQTAVASTEFFVLSPKQPVCSAFLYSMMSSPEFALDLQTLVTGTSNSHQRVQPDAFMNYATVVPSGPVAETFSELAKPWLDQVLTNRKESAALRAMRDDLLPRLLSGEVEVAEVEEMALG